MRHDDERRPARLERHDRDAAQQAQLVHERIDVALGEVGQFDLVAVRAFAHLLFLLGVQERRHGRLVRRHDHAFRQVVQHHAHVGDRFLVDVGAVAVAVQLHLEDVLGGQERVHVLCRQAHLALANAVEQRLEHVRHFAHVVQAEGRCPALDRVGGTEDRVQVFRVRRIDIDGQQQTLLFGEQLFRLVEKDLVKLADVDGHVEYPSGANGANGRGPLSR